MTDSEIVFLRGFRDFKIKFNSSINHMSKGVLDSVYQY